MSTRNIVFHSIPTYQHIAIAPCPEHLTEHLATSRRRPSAFQTLWKHVHSQVAVTAFVLYEDRQTGQETAVPETRLAEDSVHQGLGDEGRCEHAVEPVVETE